MMKKLMNLFMIGSFFGIIFFFSFLNFSILKNIFYQNLQNQSIDTLKDAGVNIEESYRNSFKTREKFINLYGAFQVGLKKDLIGNFEFVKDKQGYMHIFNNDKNADLFISEVNELNNLLKQYNTPLLYVQVPIREIEDYTEFSYDILNNANIALDSIENNLISNNINVLDIRDCLANNEYPKNEVFLKTDIHMKTEAEFWILKKILNKLEVNNNMTFVNKDVVLNTSNYSIVSKKMLGNLGRSTGIFYSGLDDFTLYYPKFETNMLLTNNVSGDVRTGKFENIVMNGMNSNDYNQYWVTNYLQWPSPYYNIRNTQVNNNNILIIMDSMGLRTASYLTLLCNNVTILDSRYFYGVNYLQQALDSKKYDAVIILQSTNLLYSPLITNDFNALVVDENTPTMIEKGKLYNFEVSIKNTGDETWSEEKGTRVCIFQNGYDWGYRLNIPNGDEILPGEVFTATLYNFQAPSQDAFYLEYQMVREAGSKSYFGEKKRADVVVK